MKSVRTIELRDFIIKGVTSLFESYQRYHWLSGARPLTIKQRIYLHLKLERSRTVLHQRFRILSRCPTLSKEAVPLCANLTFE